MIGMTDNKLQTSELLASGSTVNDVLVAVVTGALRRHILEGDADASPEGIRAVVPVNLRSPTADWTMGNQFTLQISLCAVVEGTLLINCGKALTDFMYTILNGLDSFGKSM